MKYLFILLLLPLQLLAQRFSTTEINKWQKQAANVTIYRDSFGVPHIYGNTDADAVFGLLYAQCEDDFARVEMNYIEKLGRLSEVVGETKLYDDLLMKVLIDQDAAKQDYEKSPAWLKKLCNAFANGINFYLHKHPKVKPALLQKFEPWFPFLWTDGSIGAINTDEITVQDIQQLYAKNTVVVKQENPFKEPDLTGSNGFAFAPKITENGNAILYINPHVTFYFRPEVHMASNEGLNAYGAVTWGQFFIYQGFNEYCGWMHTSSAVDAADTYIEKLNKKDKSFVYEYEGKLRSIVQKLISVKYKLGNKTIEKSFNIFFTHHGPILAKRNNQWLSLKADNRLKNGLQQCWLRTKAKGLNDFKKTLNLKGNISNNTVYADVAGNIAYWHGNRIPKRNLSYDWSKPVEGSIKATEWQGYHAINETVHSINPAKGWLQNCNSTPFTMSGNQSPLQKNYPEYMAPDGENFRGINAVRVLEETSSYTIDKVIAAGYNSKLAAFEVLIPALMNAYKNQSANFDSSLISFIKAPIELLQQWDFRCAQNSIASTLAIEWGQLLLPQINATVLPDSISANMVSKTKWYANHLQPDNALKLFYKVILNLQKKYGSWQIPWGQINRFQRISPAIENVFDDTKQSYPVGFASSLWGQLPSYNSRYFGNSKNRYGVHGNSFVCAVEFGKRVKAKSLLAGGISGHPASPHFFDQGEMYSKGIFKEVLFYFDEVKLKSVYKYIPGQMQ